MGDSPLSNIIGGGKAAAKDVTPIPKKGNAKKSATKEEAPKASSKATKAAPAKASTKKAPATKEKTGAPKEGVVRRASTVSKEGTKIDAFDGKEYPVTKFPTYKNSKGEIVRGDVIRANLAAYREAQKAVRIEKAKEREAAKAAKARAREDARAEEAARKGSGGDA